MNNENEYRGFTKITMEPDCYHKGFNGWGGTWMIYQKHNGWLANPSIFKTNAKIYSPSLDGVIDRIQVIMRQELKDELIQIGTEMAEDLKSMQRKEVDYSVVRAKAFERNLRRHRLKEVAPW